MIAARVCRDGAVRPPWIATVALVAGILSLLAAL